MKKALVILASVAMVCSLASCGGGRAMKNDVDTLSYALGTDFGGSLAQLVGSLEDELDMDLFYKGVEDALAEKAVMDRETAFAFLREYFNVTAPQKALAKSQEYLAEVAKGKNVKKTESGLLYEIVREGNPEKKAVNDADQVRVMYEGKLKNGKVFDSSYERGEPLEFICGVGMMIPGFDKAVVDMDVGDMVDIHLMPEEAYGPVNPNAFIHAPLSALPRGDELEVGMRIYLQGPAGAPMPVKVVEKDEETITFDANHELAGQELNFKIELVEVLD